MRPKLQAEVGLRPERRDLLHIAPRLPKEREPHDKKEAEVSGLGSRSNGGAESIQTDPDESVELLLLL